MEVHDPSGRVWYVRRRLIQLPRWGGFSSPRLDPSDGIGLVPDVGGFEAFAIGIVIVVTLVLSIVLVWPLVVFALELVVAAVLLTVRFLLGRWTVIAETTGERRTWHVRGNRASQRFAAHLADLIRSGSPLPVEASFESTPTPGEPPSPPGPSGNVRVIRR